MENGFSKGLGAVAFGVSLSVLVPGSAIAKNLPIQKTPDHVPGQLVVKFRDSSPSFQAQSTVISALQKRLGENGVLDIKPFVTDKSLHVVKIAQDAQMAAAISALKAEPSVEFSEPNWIYHTFDDGIPNDPDFGQTWGIHNTGQADSGGQVGHAGSDINVLPLWQMGLHGSRKVLVAVIDTGIDWTHPDLEANLYTNPGEIAGNGKDDDGNGFIDDIHGWNFVANNNQSQDDHNHGSHCSGTIGAVGGNSKGVAGVNWEVSLMPVKFLDANGSGSLDAAVNAINYARMMKVNIMSNSWGGGGYSDALKNAISAAKDAGILFVAAAGNETNNNDGNPTYPAGYQVDNVLAVAATDNQDKIASFSNYGATSVHVAAPGVKIYSTTKGGTYSVFSGTSMATPHVAGISALLLSANPGWTYGEIKDRLIKTSDPVQGLKRKVASHGRVNAYNALKGIIPPNDDPDESLWKTVSQTIESAHPYANNQDLTFTVKQAGAKYLRLHFEKIDVEANYDKVIIQTPSGEEIEEITGTATNYTTGYVKGDTLVIRLKTDESNTAFGFKMDAYQVIQ